MIYNLANLDRFSFRPKASGSKAAHVLVRRLSFLSFFLGLQHGISWPTRIFLWFLWACFWRAHLTWEEIKSYGAYRKAVGCIAPLSQVQVKLGHLSDFLSKSMHFKLKNYTIVCSQRTYHHIYTAASSVARSAKPESYLCLCIDCILFMKCWFTVVVLRKHLDICQMFLWFERYFACHQIVYELPQF